VPPKERWAQPADRLPVMTQSRGTKRAVVGVVAGLVLSIAGSAWAVDAHNLPQPRPDDTTRRPQLGIPPAAEPPSINVPAAPFAQVLTSQELHVPQGLRLLVFAPHPDDETIAAAGLIQRVRGRQGVVRVVFVTNGDGYVDGVRRETHRTETSTRDFIQYGRRRHDEALRAVETLGLDKADALFLGFPDDGIDDLWAGHWSTARPYRSPYTRAERPPYKESRNPRAEYAGVDLQTEITRVLREFDPDWVVMPDPRDRHPDHCTSAVFVLNALRSLRNERAPVGAHERVFTYLVHSPDYPASPTWVKRIAGTGVGGSETAGGALSTTRWFSLALDASELARKQNAVSAYQSQVDVMNTFLAQFLRSSELFGELDATQIITVPHEYATRFRRRP
jgi:mycothiol S-conjugate amidase